MISDWRRLNSARQTLWSALKSCRREVASSGDSGLEGTDELWPFQHVDARQYQTTHLIDDRLEEVSELSCLAEAVKFDMTPS